MKKIALVFPDLLPMPAVRGGATETLIQRLIDDNEHRRECEFHIYCPYDAEAEAAAQKYQCSRFFYIKPDEGVLAKLRFQLFRVRRKLSRHYVPEAYLTSLLKMLKKERYDAVIVESVHWFMPYIKKKVDCPVFLHLHFDAGQTLEWSLQGCDCVICVSKFIESLVNALGTQVKTCVLQNVVDCERFLPQQHETAAQELQQHLSIAEENTVVFYGGRLSEVKGVLELVKAFKAASEQTEGLKLVLAGSAVYGKTVYDSFYDQVMKEIGTCLGKNIFMVGYVDHADMPAYYAMAKMVVMPTTLVEEAAGLSALEALAAGCYFIGSDSGAVPEVSNCDSTVIVRRNQQFVKNLTQAIVDCAAAQKPVFPTPGQRHVKEMHNAKCYYDNLMRLLGRMGI